MSGMSGSKIVKWSAVLALLVGLRGPSALAMDRDLRAVMITTGYGIGIGAVAGATVAPLTKDAQPVLIGSVVGLSLGLATGIYYILNRDDPQNPLRLEQESSGLAPWESGAPVSAQRLEKATSLPPGEVQVSAVVLKF